MARGVRIASVFAAATAALLAMPAFGADLDRACTRELINRTPAITELQATLNAIFDRTAAPSIETADGVTGDAGPMEVLIVRIKDGKPVVECVDTKAAAERFLNAPLSQIGSKKAEEK